MIEIPRPTVKSGRRYGQERSRRKAGGYKKPPAYRKVRKDRGTPRSN